jgi:ribosomal 50S subunit-recycling heat shock protein
MSPHYCAYTNPEVLRVEGELMPSDNVRLGDEINIKLLGREYAAVVVELGVREVRMLESRGYWVAEAKA